MRTLRFRTQAMLALAASLAVIAALSRPWYARTPASVQDDGAGELGDPVETLAETVRRWLSDPAGTSGWDALGGWAPALAALAAVVAVGALCCLLPPMQGIAREALRYASIACFCLVLWKLFDQPGPNDALEPRYGAFLAVGAALMALTSSSAVASAPLQR